MRWDLEIAARRVLEPIRRRMSRARAGTAGAPLVPATAGRLVELVGPSGVGKSTLVDLFLSRARGEWLCREEIAAFGDDLVDRDAGDGVHVSGDTTN
jgi:MoxR-like ATPase